MRDLVRLGPVALALFAVACPGEDPVAECIFDTDCGGGELCSLGICESEERFRCAGGEQPTMIVRPIALDFGVVTRLRVAETLTITNGGACTLQISRLTLAGDERFLCPRCDGAELPIEVFPGRDVPLDLFLDPGPPGPVQGTLTLQTNESSRPEVEVELNAISEGGPKLFAGQDTIDFGYVALGQSKTRVVQVINDTAGSSPVVVVSATIEPTDVFRVNADPALPVELAPARTDPEADVRLLVTYTPPPGATNPTAVLRVRPDIGDPIEIMLSGATVPPTAEVSATEVDFGTVMLGQTGAGAVTLQNTGPTRLEATAVLVSGGLGGQFTMPRDLPASLGPGEAFELNLLFSPTVAGVVRESLRIETNDPAVGTVDVVLEGMGEATGQDVAQIVMSFDSDSSSLFDLDLRDVDLILEAPSGRICGPEQPTPDWDIEGRPRWSASGSHDNPEQVILTDAQVDGDYKVTLSYQEDCATLPSGLTASLLGIGTDALIDYFSDGDVALDPDDVADAVQTACVERRPSAAVVTVYVNGVEVGGRTISMAEKGGLATPVTLRRENGFFSLQ